MGLIDFAHDLSLAVVIHIVLIDLLLSADNAMVIALACRNLDAAKRRQGLVWGTLLAIGLRLVLIFVALNLLSVPGLKIVGGFLIAWLAMRQIQATSPQVSRSVTGVATTASLWFAIKTIIVADFVMSLDNVVAVAGAVHVGMLGAPSAAQFVAVLLGLLMSVPILLFGASLLLKLMDRYRALVLAGAGLLGWVAAGMVVTDKVVLDQFGEISTLAKLTIQAMGAVVVVIIGRYGFARGQHG